MIPVTCSHPNQMMARKVILRCCMGVYGITHLNVPNCMQLDMDWHDMVSYAQKSKKWERKRKEQKNLRALTWVILYKVHVEDPQPVL